MRITDLLDARSILLDASPKSKSEALDQIVDLMVKSEKINDNCLLYTSDAADE